MKNIGKKLSNLIKKLDKKLTFYKKYTNKITLYI